MPFIFNANELAAAFHAERLKRKISRSKIADWIDCDRCVIDDLEAGRDVDLDHIFAAFRALGLVLSVQDRSTLPPEDLQEIFSEPAEENMELHAERTHAIELKMKIKGSQQVLVGALRRIGPKR